ncbi:MAG: leucine--tRNA ligase [Gammaproteobacteria bacterium]|nr:leucine--tRNA ligase [Gammaproteobacteria bacterium]
MNSYDPSVVEAKWQNRWEERGTNLFSKQHLLAAPDPFYNLMMFPYPSAEGLHIGNIYAYTGADVQGRFQRLNGKTVFEPIGFDAFGIHSENFALKTGTNPNELIPKNIENFARQLRRFGGMYDWNHTVDTTDPAYYKWTQWIFVKLYKAGLVVRRNAAVNWCPQCKTVLANEQVIDGLCERCDASVEQRQLPQWFLRITNYAKRLLENIPKLDWSTTTKVAQTNWIGASQGANVLFRVAGLDEAIEVFTTRPDTLFGATYMVLAPEHPLVERLTTTEQREVVKHYVDSVQHQDLVERQKLDRDKTGVPTGSDCINPVNGHAIPIWISDYVLAGYGTGAIMAVPAHDQRDFEFAKKFDLPIRTVVQPDQDGSEVYVEQAYQGEGILVNSNEFDGLASQAAKKEIVASLNDKGLGSETTTYRLHDWCISRQRYWGPPIPIIHCNSCGPVVVDEDDLPVRLPYLEDFKPDETGESPLSRDAEWCNVACPSCGKPAKRETDVSDTFLDSAWYFLRYPCTDDPNNAFDSRLLEKWLPVHSYIGGNEHAVLHLLYSRFLTMALHDFGHLEFEEPYRKFRAHGLLIRDGKKISKSRGNVIVPDDLIVEYGADTVRMYLMFLGPFEQGGDYQEHGIQGPRTFLNRLWQSVSEAVDEPIDPKVEKELHRTIKQVSNSIHDLRFNTAIANMMEYLNVVRSGGRQPRRCEVEPLVIMVAPFCPHIAEELHEHLGHSESIFDSASWPAFDLKLLEAEEVEIAVQVNGKLRATIRCPTNASEDEVAQQALKHPNVSRYTNSGTIKRRIFVPSRMLSFVVAQ